MNRPNDFDNVSEYGNFKPLPPGAYVCKVVRVEEGDSRKGSKLLKIALDIAEGEYAGHFKRSFDSDNRADKKWPCIFYQPIYDADGTTSRGFKTFITSVERSNGGVPTVWGDRFCAALKGKKVGCLFRREEYLNKDGDSKWNTKCFMFRSVDSLGDCDMPKDKPLSESTHSYGGSTPASDYSRVSDYPNEETEDNVPF